MTTPARPPAPPRGANRAGSGALLHLCRRLHFYAGVLVAPFLLIAAISGGLYALAPSAENLIHRDLLHTDSTGPARSVAAQIEAAHTAHPDLTVTAVRPAASPGDTTRVLFDDPDLPEYTSLAVFVDPVTLRVQGDLPSYGSSGSLPVRTWLDKLHRDLHLGEPGRLYSELAASWLWVIALAGLVLWIATYRKDRRNRGSGRLFTVGLRRSSDGGRRDSTGERRGSTDRTRGSTGGMRSAVDGRRGSAARVRTRNWHGVLGIWIVVALVFLSATGLTWSKYAGAHVSELRSALHWTQPSVGTALDPATADPAEHSAHGHGGHGHGGPAPTGSAEVAAANAGYADTALALARTAGVGRDEAVEITVPADEATAFTVTEIRAPWQFSPDTAVADPAHDRVVAVDRFADWPLAAQLANLGIALHMGLLFGLLNQLVLCAIAVALVAVIVHGYRMWWQRRPRGTRRPGTAPSRGAVVDLATGSTRDRVSLAVVVLVAVAVGRFVPLLGWPLLAFLAIDVALGLIRRQRPARASTSST
ncbi:MAG: PepSY domain-containing protein [Gordonia sp. (in: high G+C Gram-positive bacteria)]|uniref:PepSY-associated TM helix domain-containing protein n=1 Tax=Gordonia sp. (in: high G+C Gram-positive bacteria) TaxID=84139 RepID=UPI0039E49A9B